MQIIKDINAISKRVKDSELNTKLIELQSKILEIQSENIEIKSEMEEMKKQTNISNRLVYEKDAYYVDDNKEPYCALCWDREKKLIHLVVGKFSYCEAYCPNCKTRVTKVRNGVGSSERTF